MRVHCTACDHGADLDRLDAVQGGFGFGCPACGVVNVLAPAGATGPADASAVSTGSTAEAEPAVEPTAASSTAPASAHQVGPPPGTVECPKCQHWQPGGDQACHRCGLMFAYAATGRARLPGDPLEGHPAAETIRRKWDALADDLDDTEGHHGFIRLCAEADLLEYAGFCYRKLAARSRGADPRLAGYRQRVLEAAMARVGRMEQRIDGQTRRLRTLVILLVAALIVFILAFGYYLLTKYQLTRQYEGRRPAATQHLANSGGPGHHGPMASMAVTDRRGG